MYTSQKMDTRTKKLEGNKYSRLTVVRYSHSKNGQTYWECECECGGKITTRRNRLISGASKSCGCFNKERASIWLKKYASSDKHIGKGNPQWKGGDTSVGSIHQWLYRHFKKDRCETCGSNKNLDWALKKLKKYEHKRENFHVLCRSCHLKYDYTDERRAKMGRLLTQARIKNNSIINT